MSVDRRRRARYDEADRLQRERGRVYYALSDFTAKISARDFIDVLADVATMNANFAEERQLGKRESDEWRRLAEVLEGLLGQPPED